MHSNWVLVEFDGDDITDLDTEGNDAVEVVTDDEGRAIHGIVRGGFPNMEQIFLISRGPDDWTLADDGGTGENKVYLTGGDKTISPGPPFWLVYNENGDRGAGWYGEATTNPTIAGFGAEGSVSNAAVRYLLPWNTSNSGNASIQSYVVPFDCIAQDMYVRCASAGVGTGGTIDFMLGTVDDANTTFTATALHVDYDVDAALKQSDTEHKVTLVKGQCIGVRTTPTSVTTSPTRPYVTISLIPI